MLDMLTYGRFKSMRHRALAPSQLGSFRISIPYFFDFGWSANMVRLPLDHLPPLSDEEKAAAEARWASGTFKNVSGQWWNYLEKKVQKVFPELKLDDLEDNAWITRLLRRDLLLLFRYVLPQNSHFWLEGYRDSMDYLVKHEVHDRGHETPKLLYITCRPGETKNCVILMTSVASCTDIIICH